MSLNDIHYHPLTSVAKHIQAGELSPVELTSAMLARIEATS